MSTQPPVGAYSIGGGISPIIDFNNAVIFVRNPTTADTDYPLGQMWVNKSANTSYVLTSFSTSTGILSATWTTNAASGISTLTGDTGGAISPTAGNINIIGGDTVSVAGSGSTLTIDTDIGGYPISPYVVGPSGQAGYQTIQSAITAANGAGGGVVFIQPGTYTENLTLEPDVSLQGEDFALVNIVGMHTPPTTGAVTIRNCTLTSASHIINSAVAGAASLVFDFCLLSATDGYTLNIPNWTGFIHIDDSACTGTNDGVLNNTGGSEVSLVNADLGVGTGHALTYSGGSFTMETVTLSCPITIGTGATFALQQGCAFLGTLTTANNATGYASGCTFSTGATAAISHGSSGAVTITNCAVTSSNNPSIAGAGAGTLTLTGIEFSSNAALSGTLTLAWGTTKTGAFTQVGASSFSGGTVTVASGTSAINISADAAATTVNVATGAAVKTTTVGSTNSTSSTTVQSGSGALALTSTNGTWTGISGTGALGLSTDAAATTVSLATGAAVKTVTLGSTNSTSATTVQSGSGALAITSTNGALTANSGTGALGISTDAAATTLSIGTGAGAKTVTVGSTNTTSTTNLTAGSGSVNCATDFNLTSVATKITMNGGAVTDFIGTGVLNNGVLAVANTNISTTDRIFLSRTAANASSALGMLSYTIVNATSFTVTALETATPADTEVGDQSSFVYFIVRQT